jgi:hypothetical protein
MGVAKTTSKSLGGGFGHLRQAGLGVAAPPYDPMGWFGHPQWSNPKYYYYYYYYYYYFLFCLVGVAEPTFKGHGSGSSTPKLAMGVAQPPLFFSIF